MRLVLGKILFPPEKSAPTRLFGGNGVQAGELKLVLAIVKVAAAVIGRLHKPLADDVDD